MTIIVQRLKPDILLSHLFAANPIDDREWGRGCKAEGQAAYRCEASTGPDDREAVTPGANKKQPTIQGPQEGLTPAKMQ